MAKQMSDRSSIFHLGELFDLGTNTYLEGAIKDDTAFNRPYWGRVKDKCISFGDLAEWSTQQSVDANMTYKVYKGMENTSLLTPYTDCCGRKQYKVYHREDYAPSWLVAAQCDRLDKVMNTFICISFTKVPVDPIWSDNEACDQGCFMPIDRRCGSFRGCNEGTFPLEGYYSVYNCDRAIYIDEFPYDISPFFLLLWPCIFFIFISIYVKYSILPLFTRFKTMKPVYFED